MARLFRPVRLSVVLALLTLGVCQAGDWPQFRGPAGDGHYEGKPLPTKWSDTAGVKWKVPVHDKGWSSPVVGGKHVWLTTATEDGTALYALAFDRATGATVHDLKLFSPVNPPDLRRFNSHASPTPCLDGGKLYAHFGSYGTACLDADTGKTLWSRDDLPCDHYRGPASSPVVHEGTLFLQFDGFDKQYVAALDKLTGKTIWTKDRKLPYPDNGDFKKAFATPSVFVVNGRAQLVSPAAMGTIAYDAATGDEVWRYVHGGMNEAAKPLYAHGLVYLTSGHTGQLLAVPPGTGDLTAAGPKWKHIKEVPTKPSLVAAGDLLFMVSDGGIATCLEAATGKVVKQERLQGGFASSPLLADGKLYCAADVGGKTYVLSADRKMEVLETNVLPAGCMASPAAADGTLYLRTRTHLYAVGE